MTAPAGPPASPIELLTALIPLLRPPVPPPAERGDLTRTIVGGIAALLGAIVLGLIFWVGTSVSGLSTAVTKIGGSVDQALTAISALQKTQDSTATQLSDTRAVNAKQDARADAQEADISRMKERIRIVEGQKPLSVGRPVEPF